MLVTWLRSKVGLGAWVDGRAGARVEKKSKQHLWTPLSTWGAMEDAKVVSPPGRARSSPWAVSSASIRAVRLGMAGLRGPSTSR